jgi:hypothetical protein
MGRRSARWENRDRRRNTRLSRADTRYTPRVKTPRNTRADTTRWRLSSCRTWREMAATLRWGMKVANRKLDSGGSAWNSVWVVTRY